MPTRCKKGFNRYPPKTGDCISKSEIPKKKVSMKNKRSTENKTSNSRKPRCKNGTRRHPPKTGMCVEKHLIGKKGRVSTPVLSSNDSFEDNWKCENVIAQWEHTNQIEMSDEQREEVEKICKNNKKLSINRLYNLVIERIGERF